MTRKNSNYSHSHKSSPMPTRASKRQPLASAWADWVANNIDAPDVAVVLHLPKHLADLRDGSALLEDRLRKALHRLDRHFLKTAYTRHKVKIPRFVTHEFSDGVGWHAHAICKLPLDKKIGTTVGVDEFRDALAECWGAVVGKDTESFFNFAVYAEPVTGNYLMYSLKQLDWTNAQGQVDVSNTVGDSCTSHCS